MGVTAREGYTTTLVRAALAWGAAVATDAAFSIGFAVAQSISVHGLANTTLHNVGFEIALQAPSCLETAAEAMLFVGLPIGVLLHLIRFRTWWAFTGVSAALSLVAGVVFWGVLGIFAGSVIGMIETTAPIILGGVLQGAATGWVAWRIAYRHTPSREGAG